jgi:hypothetical protein
LSEEKIDNTLLNKGYCSKFTKEEVSPMITRRYPRTRRGLLSVTGLTAALVGAALSMLSPRVAVTQAFPQSCAGTYLITVDGTGAPEMWVLEKDGVFLSIDSSQRRGNFSDQQGAWEKDGTTASRACYSISISRLTPAARRSTSAAMTSP